MKIDVLWTPLELERAPPIQERTAVAVDVLRTGTCVAAAIHNGARAVVPAESIEEALRISNSSGRDGALVCGERQGARIEGFDLGNSPAEFKSEVVHGRTIVMTTTNGTQTLTAMAGAGVVYIAALVNLSRIVAALRSAEADPLIVCAGCEGRVSLEDALCAGLMVEALSKKRKKSIGAELGDGAQAALALARELSPLSVKTLRSTAAGRALEKIGQGADIELCAQLDSIPVVPVLRDHQIVGLEPSAGSGGGGKGRAK
jgi:2-phosphosulfolactate phosphatase